PQGRGVAGQAPGLGRAHDRTPQVCAGGGPSASPQVLSRDAWPPDHQTLSIVDFFREPDPGRQAATPARPPAPPPSRSRIARRVPPVDRRETAQACDLCDRGELWLLRRARVED